jgi:hypothetical protein
MNTSTLKALDIIHNQARSLPVTPRGRALHTVDWFLNGKPVLRKHDYSCLDPKGCFSGHAVQ